MAAQGKRTIPTGRKQVAIDVRHATFGEMHGAVSALLRRAPGILFAMALLLAGFAGGLYVAQYKVFPHALLSAAYKTFVAAVEVNLHPPVYG